MHFKHLISLPGNFFTFHYEESVKNNFVSWLFLLTQSLLCDKLCQTQVKILKSINLKPNFIYSYEIHHIKQN